MQEIHTHTRAVAGKSFPNVLTKRSIQYKYDDYSIIRLIFSHRDHCAIKISKKKLKKKIFEKKKNEKFVKLKRDRAGKSIPALGLGMDFPAFFNFFFFFFQLFFFFQNLLGFSCFLMPK